MGLEPEKTTITLRNEDELHVNIADKPRHVLSTDSSNVYAYYSLIFRDHAVHELTWEFSSCGAKALMEALNHVGAVRNFLVHVSLILSTNA